MLVHRRVTPSSKFAGTHLYTWVERGTVRVKYLVQEHNAVPRAGLEPRPFDPESSALTIGPLRLPQYRIHLKLRIQQALCVMFRLKSFTPDYIHIWHKQLTIPIFFQQCNKYIFSQENKNPLKNLDSLKSH